MPIIDGKKLAEEIKAELKTEVLGLNKKIRLAVIKVGKNPVTEKFLEQKKILFYLAGFQFFQSVL